MSITWDEKTDARLQALKAEGWRWTSISRDMGITKEEGLARLGALRRSGAKTVPTLKVVSAREAPIQDRDGLQWLRTRRKLTPHQLSAALEYRTAFRLSAMDGPTIKSGLDIQEGHGAGPDGPVGRIISETDAKRRLFVMRYVVLCGQGDMLNVVDGVCGNGLTLRELAGNSGPKTMVMEALLKVALDMLAKAARDSLTNGTETADHKRSA